jgi:hypothetical protein
MAEDRDSRICRRFRSLQRDQYAYSNITGSDWGTYATKLSIEVSIGFVFNDLRKEASPGVRATAVDGMAGRSYSFLILLLFFFCVFSSFFL